MMKKVCSILLSILVFAWFSASSAFADYTYDYESGNSYIYNSSPGGGGYLYGWNAGDGSNWNTTYFPDGNMWGMDSSGDFWQYNATTGDYWNSDGTFYSGDW